MNWLIDEVPKELIEAYVDQAVMEASNIPPSLCSFVIVGPRQMLATEIMHFCQPKVISMRLLQVKAFVIKEVCRRSERHSHGTSSRQPFASDHRFLAKLEQGNYSSARASPFPIANRYQNLKYSTLPAQDHLQLDPNTLSPSFLIPNRLLCGLSTGVSCHLTKMRRHAQTRQPLKRVEADILVLFVSLGCPCISGFVK